MATIYADELVRQRAGRNLQPHEWHGKVREIKYDFAALPAGNVGDVLVLGRLLKDERILLGAEWHSAGGAGTFHIGTYAIAADGISLGAVITAAQFVNGASNAVSAAPLLWPLTTATFPNFIATADVFLAITNVGTAFTTAARFTGSVLIVGD